MMKTWFECRIRYEKVMENGMSKKVTEPYLVDALSFTEAEARIIEQMAPYISGEFTVRDIKRASYSEVFYTDEVVADKWYKGRLGFIAVDEKEIKDSFTMMASQGYFIEPTSAAVVAGVRKYLASKEKKESEIIVTAFTGHGLKAVEKIISWL